MSAGGGGNKGGNDGSGHPQKQGVGPTTTRNPRLTGRRVITMAALSALAPSDQKRFLGERLYPIVEPILVPPFSGYVGKITGMLLELQNLEIVELLDDHSLLRSRIVEALRVLDEFNWRPGQH